MALNASKVVRKSSSKSASAPIEVGSYIGRLVQVIDTGCQAAQSWDDTTKKFSLDPDKAPATELLLTYELGTEFMKNEDGTDNEDKPRWISETVKLYSLTSDKATSTKRYNVFDPSHENDGDWASQVGKPCMIVVGHTGSGKAKVGSVTAAPKGFPVPQLKNEVKVFDLSAPDLDVFKSLPDWIQTRITDSLDFSSSPLAAMLSGGSSAAKPQAPKASVAPAPKETPAEPPMGSDGDNEDSPW